MGSAARCSATGVSGLRRTRLVLVGNLETALMVMRLDPDPAIADLVYARANANTSLPVRELMWGTPGSVIACTHMAAMTADRQWRVLITIQAARLLRELEEPVAPDKVGSATAILWRGLTKRQ